MVAAGAASGESSGDCSGEVNGDGRLDVFAANYNGENATVALCTSSGPVAYNTIHTAGLDTGEAYGVNAADFNKDGYQDIFVVSRNGPCALYRQTSPFKFVNVAVAAGVPPPVPPCGRSSTPMRRRNT